MRNAVTRTVFLSIVVVSLFCGATVGLMQASVDRGFSAEDVTRLTAAATLCLAVLGVALAALAYLRMIAVSSRVTTMTRTMDIAVQDLSARINRDAVKLSELSALVSLELDALSGETRRAPSLSPKRRNRRDPRPIVDRPTVSMPRATDPVFRNDMDDRTSDAAE